MKNETTSRKHCKCLAILSATLVLFSWLVLFYYSTSYMFVTTSITGMEKKFLNKTAIHFVICICMNLWRHLAVLKLESHLDHNKKPDHHAPCVCPKIHSINH